MSRRNRNRRAPEQARPDRSSPPWLRFGLAALLLACALVCYLPAVHGGFIWDDNVLLAQNPMIRAHDGLYRFWFTAEAHDYWPLTSSTFWLEWRLWGDDPTGYHVTNLVLHAIEALMLWALLARLEVPGSYLAALLFAVHPVNVESVAWIAQRKNLVALLFLLPALLFFLKAEDARPAGASVMASLRERRYLVALLLFVLALLGKGSVATFPAILLLIVWWRKGRVGWGDLARAAPFLVAAAGLAYVNVWFQTHGGAEPIRVANTGQRLLGAGAVPWFYLYKALWPVQLSFVYPQWNITSADPRWWLPATASVGVTALFVLARGRWSRPFLFAWAYFCLALVPVMGFTDVYFMKYSLVADHYQHTAIIAVVALAAAGFARWARRSSSQQRPVWLLLAAAVVVSLVMLTRQQSAIYRDENTLYRATIEANPRCWLAHYNLAVNLKAEGRREEELAHLREVIRLRPDHAGARTNLALALQDAGEFGEALPHAEEAARLQPGVAAPLVNLGILLSRAGRPAEALAPLEEAVRLAPEQPETHYNLGLTLARLDRLADAVSALEQTVRFAPGDMVARAELARNLIRLGRREDATAQYEAVLRLSPAGPFAHEAYYNLGVLAGEAGRRRDAMEFYARALGLRPDFAEAHYNIAAALLAEGQAAEAIRHLEAAVQAKPDLLAAHMTLADAYARTGNKAGALAEARLSLPLAPPAMRPGIERAMEAWQAQASGR